MLKISIYVNDNLKLSHVFLKFRRQKFESFRQSIKKKVSESFHLKTVQLILIYIYIQPKSQKFENLAVDLKRRVQTQGIDLIQWWKEVILINTKV